MEKTDDIYRKIITLAVEKGWVPNENLRDSMHWSFEMGCFYTKTPVWDGEKIIDQLGVCNIEKIIFDHNFARIMYGEDEYAMVLSSLAILPSPERAEYMKLAYLNDENLNDSQHITADDNSLKTGDN